MKNYVLQKFNTTFSESILNENAKNCDLLFRNFCSINHLLFIVSCFEQREGLFFGQIYTRWCPIDLSRGGHDEHFWFQYWHQFSK